MRKLKLKEYIIISAVILGGILIDQLSKILATEFLKPVGTVPIIEDVFHLTYVTNRGAAFGMLSDARWVFMIISTLAIAVMGFALYSGFIKGNLATASLAVIVSGGIGNMIDRIALGYVVDFFDFRFINFAVFNIADSLVCVGAGMLILSLILDMVKDVRERKK